MTRPAQHHAPARMTRAHRKAEALMVATYTDAEPATVAELEQRFAARIEALKGRRG